ncbi:hypothetical protein P9112_003536 [Eukaryota sp. TZLM1-RC]
MDRELSLPYIEPSHLQIVREFKINKDDFADTFAARWNSLDVVVRVWSSDMIDTSLIRKELNTLSQLDHPGILHVHGTTHYRNQNAIVVEPVSTSLKVPSTFCHSTVRLAKELCEAVACLHSSNLIHGDLTPDKIWLVDERVRVSGFYNSIQTQKSNSDSDVSRKISSPLISLKYTPLEAFDNHLCESSDIYSLGVILYELLTERLAFEGCSSMSEITRAKINNYQPSFPQTIPVDLKVLITKCFDSNPHHRPSIFDIIKVLDHLTNSFPIANLPICGNDDTRGNNIQERIENEAEIDTLNDQIETLKIEIQKSQIRCEKLQLKNIKLKETVDGYKDEVSGLREELSQLEIVLQNLQQQNETLKDSVVPLRKANRDLRSSVERGDAEICFIKRRSKLIMVSLVLVSIILLFSLLMILFY